QLDEQKNRALLREHGDHPASWDEDQRNRRKTMDLARAEKTAIAAERQRRVGLGYLWWAEKSAEDGFGPVDVYQLRNDAGGQTTEVQIAQGAEGGKALDLGAQPQMTPAQYDVYKKAQGIQGLDA